MITYFEGLPRSGKSLNALKDYVVPALAKGRAVYAFIDGLNHDQIAMLAGISPDLCKSLLIPLTREQSAEFHKHVTKDSLIVIDEAESTFPSKRQPLEEGIRTYIAEHGHYGHDIVLMGQNFNELHTTWRSRTQQKLYFLKRTAAGKPDQYSVTFYNGTFDGQKTKWTELRHMKGLQYDVNYYGAYASHSADTENKENLIDERGNVWNNPVLKKWLPLFGALCIWALYEVYQAFYGDAIVKKPVDKPKAAIVQPQPASTTIAPMPQPQPDKKATIQADSAQPKFGTMNNNQKPKSFMQVDETLIPDSPEDMIDSLSHDARIRLAGYMVMNGKSQGYIEWRNDSFAVIERLTFEDLRSMGWMVLVNQDATLAIVQNYHKRYLATAWPLPDPKGFVTKQQNDTIRGVVQTPLASIQ